VTMSDGTVLTFTSATATYVSGTVTYTASATPAPVQTAPFKSSVSMVVVDPGTRHGPDRYAQDSRGAGKGHRYRGHGLG